MYLFFFLVALGYEHAVVHVIKTQDTRYSAIFTFHLKCSMKCYIEKHLKFLVICNPKQQNRIILDVGI